LFARNQSLRSLKGYVSSNCFSEEDSRIARRPWSLFNPCYWGLFRLSHGGCGRNDGELQGEVCLERIKLTSRDVTLEAHELLKGVSRSQSVVNKFPDIGGRPVVSRSFCDPFDRQPRPRSLDTIQMSRSGPELDLSALSQLVHVSQTHLIAQALYYLSTENNVLSLRRIVDQWVAQWEESMLNGDGGEEGWLAAVRAIDLGMAINRIRGLKVA